MGLLFLEKEESRTPTFEIQVRALAGKTSTGFRPNLLVKILKSTGQTCQICHMYGVICQVNRCQLLFLLHFIILESKSHITIKKRLCNQLLT